MASSERLRVHLEEPEKSCVRVLVKQSVCNILQRLAIRCRP